MTSHLGTITPCYTVFFERQTRHSVSRLWAAITNAEETSRWMGYPVRIDLRHGGEWTAEKPGTYVTEIIAGRETEEVGHEVLMFRREDGVAENFHTSQNRELLEKLTSQTGGRYFRPNETKELLDVVALSDAGLSVRETRPLWNMPAALLLFAALRAGEWLLRRKWGAV